MMSRSRFLQQTSLATLRCASQIGHAQRRFVSTLPTRRRGRVTGALLRLGLAGAAVYYYNTAGVFADEPSYASTPDTHKDADTYTTVDTIAAQRRAQARASLASEASPAELTDGSPQELEEEAEQQGAFNEETGEINWDCPCLGGMADGPCGEQFKAAFSCFVFSKEEPKGIDCIEHFKTMQNCFREHPDVYGSELEPDEGDEPIVEPQTGVAHAVDVAREHVGATVEKATDNLARDASAVSTETTSHTPAELSSPNPSEATSVAKARTGGDEGDELVPKAWHNSSDDNRGK